MKEACQEVEAEAGALVGAKALDGVGGEFLLLHICMAIDPLFI